MSNNRRSGPSILPPLPDLAGALCRGLDAEETDLFFPERKWNVKDTGERWAYEDRVKMVRRQYCYACPAQEACLAHARRAKEPAGIWGGEGVLEREQWIKDQRKVNRGSKD